LASPLKIASHNCQLRGEVDFPASVLAASELMADWDIIAQEITNTLVDSFGINPKEHFIEGHSVVAWHPGPGSWFMAISHANLTGIVKNRWHVGRSRGIQFNMLTEGLQFSSRIAPMEMLLTTARVIGVGC